MLMFVNYYRHPRPEYGAVSMGIDSRVSVGRDNEILAVARMSLSLQILRSAASMSYAIGSS
jgi:hypothetical protein